MKLFKCDHCGQPVYFENYFCVNCNALLGFDPQQLDVLALKQDNDNSFILFNRDGDISPSVKKYKFCVNKQYNVCNWLLPYESEREYCIACNLNRVIPDLNEEDGLKKWNNIEIAKHRLIYSLLRLELAVISKFQDEKNGIAFDFKADEKSGAGRLLTGHDNGLITLNIEEADDAIREMARNKMDEVYRTLLGHFRHEIGHYYWDRLIGDTEKIRAFRILFGDDRTNYSEALQRHYSKPPSNEWRNNFISSYAGSHPWEDWAETWAHYLHIIDTMETAYSFGISIDPIAVEPGHEMSAKENIDPYIAENFDDIMNRWLPLTFVMNGLNRSMGMNDSYPFVINEVVKQKLSFIHETVHISGSLSR